MELKTLKIDAELHEKLKALTDKNGQSMQYMVENHLNTLVSNNNDIMLEFCYNVQTDDKLQLTLDSTNVEKFKNLLNRFICNGNFQNIDEIKHLIELNEKIQIKPIKKHELFFKVKNVDIQNYEVLNQLINKKIKVIGLTEYSFIELLQIDSRDYYFKFIFDDNLKYSTLLNQDILYILNSVYYGLFSKTNEDDVILNIKYGEDELEYIYFSIDYKTNNNVESGLYDFVKINNSNIHISLIEYSNNKLYYAIQYSNKFNLSVTEFISKVFFILRNIKSKIYFQFDLINLNINDKPSKEDKLFKILDDEERGNLYKKIFNNFIPYFNYFKVYDKELLSTIISDLSNRTEMSIFYLGSNGISINKTDYELVNIQSDNFIIKSNNIEISFIVGKKVELIGNNIGESSELPKNNLSDYIGTLNNKYNLEKYQDFIYYGCAISFDKVKNDIYYFIDDKGNNIQLSEDDLCFVLNPITKQYII
jgi:hypothetical protein